MKWRPDAARQVLAQQNTKLLLAELCLHCGAPAGQRCLPKLMGYHRARLDAAGIAVLRHVPRVRWTRPSWISSR